MKYYKLTKDKKAVEVSREEGLKGYDTDRKVDFTQDKEYQVSTVFLVLDHGFDESGPPLVFETMVFPYNTRLDEDCERYSTWEEAKEGHKRMCEKWLKPQTYLPICMGKRLITLGE